MKRERMTKVETLPIVDSTQINEDIEYFRKKLAEALLIPEKFLRK